VNTTTVDSVAYVSGSDAEAVAEALAAYIYVIIVLAVLCPLISIGLMCVCGCGAVFACCMCCGKQAADGDASGIKKGDSHIPLDETGKTAV
jgi:hypothetical protein